MWRCCKRALQVEWKHSFLFPVRFSVCGREREQLCLSILSVPLSRPVCCISEPIGADQRRGAQTGGKASQTGGFGCERPPQEKFKIPKTLPRKCSRKNRKWSHCLQPPPSSACDFPPSQYPRWLHLHKWLHGRGVLLEKEWWHRRCRITATVSSQAGSCSSSFPASAPPPPTPTALQMVTTLITRSCD